MILVRDTRVFSTTRRSYQPAPLFAESAARFWAQTTIERGHRLWAGRGIRPRFMARGASFAVHDFAYRLEVGDIWPYLRAASTCGVELCLDPTHLHLKRAGRLAPLTEADWDTLAELLYARGDNAAHKHLRTEWEVGEIYGAPEAEFELTRRLDRRPRSERAERRDEGASVFSNTVDALRIGVG